MKKRLEVAALMLTLFVVIILYSLLVFGIVTSDSPSLCDLFCICVAGIGLIFILIGLVRKSKE